MKRKENYLVNADKDAFTRYKNQFNINEQRETVIQTQKEQLSEIQDELKALKELIKGIIK
jgi:hypothetical protein